jgi:hypothetical protein
MVYAAIEMAPPTSPGTADSRTAAGSLRPRRITAAGGAPLDPKNLASACGPYNAEKAKGEAAKRRTPHATAASRLTAKYIRD